MTRFPIWYLAPGVAVLLILVFAFGLGGSDSRDTLPSTFVGRTAPVVEVTPLGDLPTLTDADLRRDEVKLVNFWASWCAPCRVEHPNLDGLAKSGVPIYGVNYKDEAAKALGFLAELGNPYLAAGQDITGRQAIEWGVYGVPETFIVDRHGKIALRWAGPITQRVLSETILPAIEAARSAP